MAKPKSEFHHFNVGNKYSYLEYLDKYRGGADIDLAPTLVPVFTGKIAADNSPEIEIRSYADLVSVRDGGGYSSLNTVFGDKLMAHRVPNITAQFYYGVDSRSIATNLTGSGAVALSGNIGYENKLAITTGATAGSTAVVESKDGVRYIPGYEFGLYATGLFKKPTGDGYIKAGLFDGFNGYYFGFKEVDDEQVFGVCRMKDGVEHFVKQADFNRDTLDGNGNSEFVLDPTKGNIFIIKSGYLGFAGTSFLIVTEDNEIIEFHKIEYPNMYEETNISNSNLPVRVEISNGTAAEEVTFETGSICGYLADGASVEVNERDQVLIVKDQTLIANVGNEHIDNPIVAFKNERLFQGSLMPSPKIHRVAAELRRISMTITGQNKAGSIEIHIFDADDVTLSVGTWRDVDTDSIMKYAINADGITANFANSIVSFADTFEPTSDKLEHFLEGSLRELRPDEVAIFVLNSGTNVDIDVYFTNAWAELF